MGMKIRHLSVFLLLLVVVAAGQPGSMLERTKLALKSGNSQQLGQMMADQIGFGFEGESTQQPSKEAVAQLHAFFRTNPVSDLAQLFQGQSKDGKQYFIGQLKAKSATYRVSVYWVEVPRNQILSIDITKE